MVLSSSTYSANTKRVFIGGVDGVKAQRGVERQVERSWTEHQVRLGIEWRSTVQHSANV